MPMRGALWYEEFDDFAVPVGSGALRGGGASSSPLGPQGADFTAVTLSGIAAVDALLAGNRWVDAEITFSFPTAASQYTDYTTGAHRLDTFTPLSQPFREAVRYILGATNPEGGPSPFLFGSVASFTNLGFGEVADGGGTMRFGFSAAHAVAWGYWPSAAAGERGDAFFNESYMGYFPTPVSGSYTWLTAIHEIGHTLGLKHAHETNGVTGTAMPSAFDSLEYTVMTYRSYEGAPADYYRNEAYGYPQTFMMMDIRALQQMYGADFTTNGEDTVYSWSDRFGDMYVNGESHGIPGANRVFLTVWDGGGYDTYDFSNYSGGISVNLTPGEYSRLSTEQLAHLGNGNYARGSVFNALQYNGDPRSLIEAAIGGDGDDVLIGNQAVNALQGGAGDDELAGGAGDDTIDGGTGTDTATFRFDNIGATQGVDFNGMNTGMPGTIQQDDGQGGTDTLIGIEQISVIGTTFTDKLQGGAGADQLNGHDGDDFLFGGDGDDHLYGGMGADSINGGRGSDIAYFTGNKADYSIKLIDGTVTVMGPGAKDFLVDVEMLRFADGDVDPLLIVCPPGDGPISGQAEAPLVLPELFDGGKEPGPEVLPPLLDEEPQILPPGLDGKPLAGDEPTVCRPGDQPDVGLDLDPPGPRIDRRLLDLDHPDLALIPGTRAEFGWTGPVSDYDWII